MHRFEIFAFENHRDHETRITGHSWSLEMKHTFERSHATSC